MAIGALGLATLTPSAFAGEAWLLSVEAPAAVPLTEPQRSLFRPGALPAAAVYRSLGANLLTGLRLRGGAFANGPAPSDPAEGDPDLGGLGALTLAVRARPLARPSEASRARGLWIELAGGAGLTGKLMRATAEAGLGWNLRIDRVTLGPSLRYLQVIQPADQLESRDARIGLVGIEIGFFDPRSIPAPLAAVPPPAPAPASDGNRDRDRDGDGIRDASDLCPEDAEDRDGFEDADGCPDLDNDRDGIGDRLDRCPDAAEVVNGVDDQDGCPDEGLIELVGDRVVLEDRVLFDTERARVKTAGRKALAALVELWRQHPEWERMLIEGHADARGPDSFNDWLSAERAERVRRVLVELGFPADRIDVKSYGRTRPRNPNRTPEGHQQNRRVEFVVVTHKPAARPAVPSPTVPPRPPEGVAPAPPSSGDPVAPALPNPPRVEP